MLQYFIWSSFSRLFLAVLPKLNTKSFLKVFTVVNRAERRFSGKNHYLETRKLTLTKCTIAELTSVFYVSLWWEVYTINFFSIHFALFCFKCIYRKIVNTNQILETIEFGINGFGYIKSQIQKPYREREQLAWMIGSLDNITVSSITSYTYMIF